MIAMKVLRTTLTTTHKPRAGNVLFKSVVDGRWEMGDGRGDGRESECTLKNVKIGYPVHVYMLPHVVIADKTGAHFNNVSIMCNIRGRFC